MLVVQPVLLGRVSYEWRDHEPIRLTVLRFHTRFTSLFYKLTTGEFKLWMRDKVRGGSRNFGKGGGGCAARNFGKGGARLPM